MVSQCCANQLKFHTVMGDIWYGSADNMKHIKLDCHKDFIFAVKGNRTVAVSRSTKLCGQFHAIESLGLEEGVAKQVYVKGVDFPVLVVKQVFINEDGSSGILYLIASNLGLKAKDIIEYYKKRWCIEVFHKAIKQNAALAKSPTQTVRTQTNHIFASMYAFCKMQIIALNAGINQFALRRKIMINANKRALLELYYLKQSAC